MFNTPEGNRLLKFGSVAVILLIVFLAVHSLYALRLTSEVGKGIYPTNIITVNGMGEIVAVPDIAMFSFGAQETAKTADAAQKAVTDKINKALDIVKTAGVAEKDIKTTSYNIYPHYQYTNSVCTQFSCPPSRQIIDGYEVSQMIEVKVRETSKAGAILGSLGSAQVTNISGLTFTIDDMEKVRADAQAKAINDAQAKAKVLARSLDVGLGKIVSFSDNNYPMPYGYGGDMAAKAMSVESAPTPEVPAGENKIISNVSITYEIK